MAFVPETVKLMQGRFRKGSQPLGDLVEGGTGISLQLQGQNRCMRTLPALLAFVSTAPHRWPPQSGEFHLRLRSDW